jgi:hypothetical protein
VDDPDAAGPLLDRLCLPPTLGWTSARGAHRVYAWDRRLDGLCLPAVVYLAEDAAELRLGGAGKQLVSVCPPTVGTDGRRRRWSGVWEVAPLPERLLGELARRAAPAAREPGRARPLPSGTARYAAAALRAESRLVRDATPGTRNRALNRAAFNLGQLVAAGVVARDVVEAALQEAALAAGLPEPEVLATLRSGLQAGLRRPRARRACEVRA